jgi:hypothetical protein
VREGVESPARTPPVSFSCLRGKSAREREEKRERGRGEESVPLPMVPTIPALSRSTEGKRGDHELDEGVVLKEGAGTGTFPYCSILFVSKSALLSRKDGEEGKRRWLGRGEKDGRTESSVGRRLSEHVNRERSFTGVDELDDSVLRGESDDRKDGTEDFLCSSRRRISFSLARREE